MPSCAFKSWIVGLAGAGAATTAVLVFGPAAWPSAVVPLLVGWSRSSTRDHTPAQVVAGTGMSAAVAATVFLALR